MIWWPSVNNAPVSATASVSSNGTIVTVTTTADITTVPESGGLVIGSNPPVEVKRGYLSGSTKRIELVKPWPYTNQTNQRCVVYPTDFNVADEVARLKNSGTDNANSALFLNTLSTSTANTVTLDLLNRADVTAVPVGKLNADLNTKRNAMSAIGRDLYSTDRQGEALAILGEQPNITPVPLLDLNFAENTYKVYENGILVDKTITEVLTTTRNSTATYNSPFGIGTAGINEPRITFDPNTGENLGFLAEQQRTNLIPNSEDISEAPWQASPTGSVSSTANAIISPSGTLTADKIQTNDTLNNGHIWFRTFSGATSTNYVASMYFKAGEYSRVSLYFGNTAFNNITTGALFDLLNGTVVTTTNNSVAKIISVGGGWYRCSVTATSHTSGVNYVVSVVPKPSTETQVASTFVPNSTGLGVFVWGAQVEEGTFTTSYIPTQASQVTRANQLVVYPLNGLDLDEITVFGELRFITTGINPNGGNRFERFLTITNGAGAILVQLLASKGYNGFQIANSSNFVRVLNTPLPSVSTLKFAYSCKDNNFSFSFNGGLLTDNSFVLDKSRLVNLIIAENSSSNAFNGTIKSVKLYPYALSDADLIDLTKL